MKHLILSVVLAIAFMTTNLFAQPQYDVITETTGYDLHDYTILKSNEGFIAAGNILINGYSHIHILEIDGNNGLLWEKKYSDAEHAVCLNINYCWDEYIVTGYVEYANGTQTLYLLHIDIQGNIVNQKLYNNPYMTSSVGMYTTVDHNEDGFYVAGFVVDHHTSVAYDQMAFVMKTDRDLNVQWTRVFDNPPAVNPNADYDMAKHVLLLPNDEIYVSGIIQNPTVNQEYGVLSLKMDSGGNLMWQNSFENTNYGHIGVDAVYDNNVIYTLGINSYFHNISLTAMNLSGSFIRHAEYTPADNYAGFHLMENPYNPDAFIVAGSKTNYHTQFMAEIDKSTFEVNWAQKYQFTGGALPSYNNYFHFTGQYPLHTPKIVDENLHKPGFTLLGYRRDYSPVIDMTMYHTDQYGVNCKAVVDPIQLYSTPKVKGINIQNIHQNPFVQDPIHFNVTKVDPKFVLECPCDYIDVVSSYSVSETPTAYIFNATSTYNLPSGAVVQYLWTVNGSPYSTASSITLTPGAYTVTLETCVTTVDDQQCCDEYTQFIPAPKKAANNMEMTSEVYPNPSTGEFYLNLNNTDDIVKITVVNSLGETITKLDVNNVISFDISNHPAGTYFVKIESVNNTIVKKIIKK